MDDQPPVGRRHFAVALGAVAAAGALGASPANAVACCGTVYDPAVEAGVLDGVAKSAEMLNEAAKQVSLLTEVRTAVGEALDFVGTLPEMQEALALLDTIEQAGAIGADACGTGKAVLGMFAGGGGLPTTDLFDLGGGDPCSVVASVSRNAGMIRQQLEPPVGSGMTEERAVRQRRLQEARNAVYDGLGEAFQIAGSGKRSLDGLQQIGALLRGGRPTVQRGIATLNTVQTMALEQGQLTNRLLAALLRVQATTALKDEAVTNYVRPAAPAGTPG